MNDDDDDESVSLSLSLSVVLARNSRAGTLGEPWCVTKASLKQHDVDKSKMDRRKPIIVMGRWLYLSVLFVRRSGQIISIDHVGETS